MPRKVIMRGLALVTLLLIMGTAFYSYAENLSFVDAFYFSGATLTTLGYGDIVPTNDASKIFTVFYALLGIGLIFYIFTEIFRLFFTGKLLKHEKKKS